METVLNKRDMLLTLHYFCMGTSELNYKNKISLVFKSVQVVR